MNINCHHCGKSYLISDERAREIAGRAVTCPACKRQFQVPAKVAAKSGNDATGPVSGTVPPEIPVLRPAPGQIRESGAPLPATGAKPAPGNQFPEIRVEGRSGGSSPNSKAALLRERRKRDSRFLGMMIAGLFAAAAALTVGVGWWQGWLSGWAGKPTGIVAIQLGAIDRNTVRVWIDDQQEAFPAEGNAQYALPEGTHTVVVERKGYHEHRKLLRIQKGSKVSVSPVWIPRIEVAARRSEQAERNPALRENSPGGNDQSDRAQVSKTPVGKTDSPGVFDSWTQNFDAAMAKAAEERKSVLVCFDGSDWCGYSLKMAEMVFSKPEFSEFVGEKGLIPVLIDFPRFPAARSQVEDPRRNTELAHRFGIQGYPTLVLLASDGKTIGVFGYCENGLREFRAAVSSALQGHAARLDRIARLTASVERGELPTFSELTSVLEPERWGEYLDLFTEWRDKANQLDPDNQSGLNEGAFVYWCNAQMRAIDSESTIETTLYRVADLTADWLRKHQSRNPDDVGLLIENLSRVLRLFDLKRSVDLATLGQKIPGLDDELQNGLNALASNETGTGSGFVIADSGLIITNAHVVEFGSAIEVRIGDDLSKAMPAEILAIDREIDLAVLKVTGEGKFQSLEFDATMPGRLSEVAISGYPRGSSSIKSVTGRITGNEENGLVEINALVNPGNSGGPVLSPQGRVVAVISAKTTSDEITDSTGLAIPSAVVLQYLERVLERQDFRKIRSGSRGKEIDWRLVDQRTVPSLVRVTSKFRLMSREEASTANEERWKFVAATDSDPKKCREMLGAAIETAVAWPRPEHYRTAALAAWRCAEKEKVLGLMSKCFESLTLLRELPHPVDHSLVALVLAEAGQPELAARHRDEFRFLSVRSPWIDDSLVNEFASELEKHFGD